MNNTIFTSKKLNGRGFSSAPRINNYNKSVNTKEEQSGRSMIEMLGVLAIIGVLSVGGIAGYSKAMMKYRINKTIEQITLIAGNIRSFFAPQGNYKGVNDNVILRKAKIIPDDMWDDSGYIMSVWGGTIWLYPQGRSKEGDNKAFFIDFEGSTDSIPLEACIELTSLDWSSAGVKAFGIGYTTYHKFLKTPVSLEKAIEVCSDAYEKNDGEVYYDLGFDTEIGSEAWPNTRFYN